MYNPYNPKAVTFKNLLHSFKEYLLAEKISKGSVRSYLSDIRHFFAWLSSFLQSHHLVDSGDLSPLDLINQVNKKVLETYKQNQLDNNVPIKTINRRFSSLRRFGNFLESENPFKTSAAREMNTFDTLKNVSEEEKVFKEDQYHLEEFRLHLWKKGSSKSTLKNYLNDVRQFLEWEEKQAIK